jgi:hypothetical protein
MTFLGALVLAPNFSMAQVKDSFYFMKDDNEFSDEEKDLEAQYVFETCNQNFIQRVYFDCGCVAGAFRVERDKEDLIPQTTIVHNIMSEKRPECANSIGIAGETYEFCTEYARVFRERKTNNEGYCSCVANNTANKFKKKPRLSLRYIEDIRLDSMLTCNEEYP